MNEKNSSPAKQGEASSVPSELEQGQVGFLDLFVFILDFSVGLFLVNMLLNCFSLRVTLLWVCMRHEGVGGKFQLSRRIKQ